MNPTAGGGAVRATRRGFLKILGSGAAFATLSQLRLPPGAAAAARSPGPDFLDAREAEILTHVMERMVDTGVPTAPRVRDTDAVAAVDGLCRSLDPGVSGQIPLLLQLFEYGPIVFDFTPSRFTRMTDTQKDASLEAWMTSRLGIRRLAFTALRNLCFFGYWSQDATWPLIGYAGPLLRPSAS